MTTELTKAAQQALEAFDAFADADDFPTCFELTKKMNALRRALTASQPAPTAQELERAAEMCDGFAAPDMAAALRSQPAQAGEVDERVAFEAWLGREAFTKRSDSGKYESVHVDAMWSAWQARASMPTQPAAQATPDVPETDFGNMATQQATPEPVGEPTEGEFFAFDPEGGSAFYKTRQEAINHAKESLKYYQDGAKGHGEWDEDVEHVRWGVVMQRAKATNISATEDGESSCDYELQDVATRPAPGVPEGFALLLERAQRLVEFADFKLGGVLSAESDLREIPSKAGSWVKTRHLAALRDSVRALAAAQAKGGEHD